MAKTLRIAFHLFKKDVKDFDEAWKQGGSEGFEEVALTGITYDARAYILRNHKTTPPWVEYVGPFCKDAKIDKLFSQSNSFVLLIKAKQRIFAITFGYASSALDRSKLEHDFGLKVTLNSVDSQKLRSMQARNVDTTTLSKQLVVNRNASLSVFDVDLYRELLSKLEGIPNNRALGSRLSGADTCWLSSKVQFSELAARCVELLTLYRKKTYQSNFRAVDQLRPVQEADLLQDLNAKLADAIRSQNTTLAMALPDIALYGQIEGYRLKSGPWKEGFQDLDAKEVFEAFESAPDGTDPLNTRVEALNSSEQVIQAFPLKDAAVYEVKHGGRHYVFTLRQWFQIDKDYVDRVNREVRNVQVIRDTTYLPPINKSETEGGYNERAAKKAGLALMDKKCVAIPGETTIEVCDIYSKKREFIHVKRKVRSATLSHLLSQGSVSARLFHQYEDYRKWFTQKLPTSMKTTVNAASVRSGKFSVVYAITAPKGLKIPTGLPFFSKVNLLFHTKLIRLMGYTVKVFHIRENWH